MLCIPTPFDQICNKEIFIFRIWLSELSCVETRLFHILFSSPKWCPGWCSASYCGGPALTTLQTYSANQLPLPQLALVFRTKKHGYLIWWFLNADSEMKWCAIHFLEFLLKSGSTRLDVDKCLEKVSIKLKIKKIKSTPNKKPFYKETVQTGGKQKKCLTGLTTGITVL